MADEFDFETGLFSGVATVQDEWFAVGEQNPNTQLFLKVVDDSGTEHELRYGCGPDWASFDGGDTVEHPKGGERRYNTKTPVAELFRFAFESGAEDILRKRSQELYSGKGPFSAKLWHGLRFDWIVKTEPYKFKNKEGETVEGEKSRSLPNSFLGEGEAVSGQAGQAQPAAAAPVADSTDPLSVLSPEDSAKAKVLAKTVPYSEWVDKMMELPNAVGSPTLMAALGDEGLYNRLKEG